MVHNAGLVEAGIDSDGGFQCFGCLERRLGRELCIVDFRAAATAGPDING